jgi:tetratricopeptide (TPR) repeat protein
MPARGSRLDHLILMVTFPGLIALALVVERVWLKPRTLSRDPASRVEIWRGHVAEHPDFAMGHVRLGQALSEAGDPAGARIAFERALELDPELAGAALGLSDTYRVQKDPRGAMAVMERFLERQPDCAECLQNVAADRFAMGDVDGALAAIEQALAERSMLPSASGTNYDPARTHLLAGRIYDAKKRTADALPHYEAALRSDPMLAPALLRAGELKMGSDPREAAKLLDRYRRLRPRDPAGARALAEALTRLGDSEGARAVLAQQRAAAATPPRQ